MSRALETCGIPPGDNTPIPRVPEGKEREKGLEIFIKEKKMAPNVPDLMKDIFKSKITQFQV